MVPFVRQSIFIAIIIAFASTAGYGESDQSLFEKGVRELQNGSFQEAIDLFTEMILVAPGNAKAFKNRGVALMKLEKYDLAIKDFNKAREIDQDLMGLYSNLGAAYHYKGDYEKAINSYNIEVSMRPGEFITYFNRALSWIEMQRHKEAISDLDKSLELNPDLPWAVSLKEEVKKALLKSGQRRVGESAASQEGTDIKSSPDALMVKREKKLTTFDKKETIQKTDTEVDKPAKGLYAVQAGAYLNKTPALKLKDRLLNKGYEARILQLVGAKGKTWHMVRIGSHLGYKKSLKIARQLKKEENLRTVICNMGKF